MKQQSKLSNEETNDDILITNPLVIDDDEVDTDHHHFNHHHNHHLNNNGSNQTMMTSTADSLDSTTTKMLMPHEMGASAVGNGASIVGQHSLHSTYGLADSLQHSSQFYHHSSTTGFNGFHNNSYHSYSALSNGTMLNGHHNHTTSSSTFSNLIHQQAPMNNNHHPVTTASSSVPPLIHQQTFYNSNSSTISDKSNQLQVINEDDVKKEEELIISEEEQVAGDDENLEGSTAVNTEPEAEIDIVISNVVCAFSVRCQLALKEIALNGANVEYKRENGMVTMKLRNPYTTASIWSSGKITCTGATSEEQAKVAARKYARVLQKLNFRVRFHNYRVVNVLGTCKMPWAIKIVQFSEKYKKEASYEPELHPGVTYNLHNPTATLKIFSTGSMTVTARSVANVQAAIEHIFPLVYEFRKPRVQLETAVIAEEVLDLIEHDSDDDDDLDDDDDPLNLDDEPETIADDEPPKKKLRSIEHLTKRYKGGAKRAKRPPGKRNDPCEDMINVSDDGDPDDFE